MLQPLNSKRLLDVNGGPRAVPELLGELEILPDVDTSRVRHCRKARRYWQHANTSKAGSKRLEMKWTFDFQ